jgi:hypothetical protein
MRKTVILIGLGVALVGSPAAAAGKSANPAQEKKYCLQYSTDTGSRINRVECRTRKEWAKLGVYVDELTN